jgi:hypothetical protein
MASNALLERDIPRMHRLLFQRNRVAIGRIGQRVREYVELPRLFFQLLEQKHAARFAGALNHRLQGLQPFPGLLGIGIGTV